MIVLIYVTIFFPGTICDERDLEESSYYGIRTNGKNKQYLQYGNPGERWKAVQRPKAPFFAIYVNEEEVVYIDSVRLTDLKNVERFTIEVSELDNQGKLKLLVSIHPHMYHYVLLTIYCSPYIDHQIFTYHEIAHHNINHPVLLTLLLPIMHCSPCNDHPVAHPHIFAFCILLTK